MNRYKTFNRSVGAPAMISLLAVLTGCRVVMLNVEDIIVYHDGSASSGNVVLARWGADDSTDSAARPVSDIRLAESREDESGRVTLCAYLEHRWSLLTVGCLGGVPVEFRRDGQVLATAVTDEKGLASYSCDAGPESWHYSARVALPTGKIVSEGEVYVWSSDRPAIVIDMDETLSQSRYLDMLFWLNDPSPPMAHARDAVHQLAQRYGIIYISTRARLFRNMTQTWLRKHEFPPGPIVHTRDFSAVFGQRAAKHAMVEMLKHRGVNVVAGIGDKSADEQAFDDAKILTIIVNPWYSPRRAKSIVVDDWSGVPDALQGALAELSPRRTTESARTLASNEWHDTGDSSGG